jgi:hypothetical protein
MVIEVVGPAGVGKSALVSELTKLGGVVRAGVWNLPRHLLARGAISSAGAIAGLWRDSGRVNVAKQVVRLSALERRVAELADGRTGSVVLDEGPVFALAWFHVFADRQRGPRPLAAWRRGATERWATALDAIVWLDAPDPVLLERLRRRSKPRDVFAGMTDPDILDLQTAYRAAFREVIGALTGATGAQLLSLDAEHTPADQLARAVAAACAGGFRGN